MSQSSKSAPPRKVELQLPSKQSIWSELRKKIIIMYFVSLTGLNFVLASLTNIEVQHETIFIGITALAYLFWGKKWKQSHQPYTLVQEIMHSFFMTFLYVIPPIVFRVPYYSWMVVLTMVIAICRVVKSPKQSKINDFDTKHTLMIMALSGLILVLYSLRDQGYVCFDICYITALPNIGALLGVWDATHRQILRFKLITRRMGRQNWLQLMAGVVRGATIFVSGVNVLVLFSRAYLPAELYLQIQVISLVFTIPFALLCHLFEPQIMILCQYRKQQRNTIFMTHFRQFTFEYDQKTCRKNISSDSTTGGRVCLLCDNSASIVADPCGHLLVCRSCIRRTKAKGPTRLKICLVCGKEYRYIAELKLQWSQSYYKGRIFNIVHRLLKNQREIL